jgi:hypothetical protein
MEITFSMLGLIEFLESCVEEIYGVSFVFYSMFKEFLKLCEKGFYLDDMFLWLSSSILC